MVLSLITEGNVTTANDLNQVVNLLNGTTTNTQVTVRGAVRAQKIPGSPAGFIGGLGNDFGGPIGQANTGVYTLNPGDMAVAPGGPIMVNAVNAITFPPTTIGEQYGFVTVSSGGYVARMHQGGTVTANAQGQLFPMDTVDYDPRGMVQPFTGAGGGFAITTPGSLDIGSPLAVMGIACSFHGTGVGSINVPLEIGAWIPGGSFPGVYQSYAQLPTPNFNGSNAYTGTSFTLITGVIPGGQLCFSLQATPSPTFTLDTTDSSRCYISVWWPN